MKVRLALEWFLNPDHLPFLIGIDQGWLAADGIELEVIEPDDHYDGFSELESGRIELACNEPLHLLEGRRPDLVALGCFFETEGGVLMHRASADRLAAGEAVRICSPVSNPTTDTLAIAILSGWMANQGKLLEPSKVTLEAVDFQHIANMKAGFDGAWLAFQNFEGVEARHEGVDALMIRTADAGIPNFSALELFTSRGVYDRDRNTIDRLRTMMDRAIAAAQADVAFARDVYYRQSKTEPSALMDAIIEDTLPRLIAPVRPQPARWHALWRDVHGRGLTDVTEADYLTLFSAD